MIAHLTTVSMSELVIPLVISMGTFTIFSGDDSAKSSMEVPPSEQATEMLEFAF